MVSPQSGPVFRKCVDDIRITKLSRPIHNSILNSTDRIGWLLQRKITIGSKAWTVSPGL